LTARARATPIVLGTRETSDLVTFLKDGRLDPRAKTAASPCAPPRHRAERHEHHALRALIPR